MRPSSIGTIGSRSELIMRVGHRTCAAAFCKKAVFAKCIIAFLYGRAYHGTSDGRILWSLPTPYLGRSLAAFLEEPPCERLNSGSAAW
jgi:hypothetical protein